MADKEKIKTILELFLAWNGETEAIDVANLDSAVEFIEESLQKEPTSENTKEDRELANTYYGNHNNMEIIDRKWQRTFEPAQNTIFRRLPIWI